MQTITTQGITMPKLGLGTFKLTDAPGQAAVESALAAPGSPPPGCLAATCTSPPRPGTTTWRPTRSAAPWTAASAS
jgi:hypothetical protein